MTRTFDTYEQAIEFVFGRINYERINSDSYTSDDFKLDRMKTLLGLLGDLQDRLPAVHIAGTKGKGSTAIMVSEILKAAGYRVGLFTSPHIEVYEERIRVDGHSPTPAQLVDLINRIQYAVTTMDGMPGPMAPTFFEITTALAWMHFADSSCDVAVLEVGLGGRLDSTNLCQPEVSVITSISRDHTRLLGTELEQIAAEKAGIVKNGVPVVSGVTSPEANQVIERICRDARATRFQINSDFRWYGNRNPAIDVRESASNIVQSVASRQLSPRLPPADTITVETPWRNFPQVSIPLNGTHQKHNAAVAVMTAEVLNRQGRPIPETAVRAGLLAVRWPARIELLMTNPTVIIDAAHNWESMNALLRTLDESYPARRRTLIFATTRDKDISGMLRLALPKFDTVIITQYMNNPRAVPTEHLHRLVRSISSRLVHIAADPSTAWKLARHLSTPEDLICIAGSFFIAAEMRELILDKPITSGKPITQSDTYASR